MTGTRQGRQRRLGWVVPLGLVAAAVAQELRKPAGERTWQGRVAGVVPYDLRPPSVDRYRRAWWDPDNPRLVTGTAFGVGWDLNVGRVVRLLRGPGG